MNYLNKYFLDVIKKCFNVQGRDNRKTFWLFQLNIVILTFILTSILNMLSSNLPKILSFLFVIVAVVYMIALACVQISLQVRRLHDINLCGWWILINFVPFVGGLAMFIMDVWSGTKGENKYGLPK